MMFTDFHIARDRLLILTCIVSLYTGLGGFGVWYGPQPWMPALILGPLLLWITMADFDRFEIPDMSVVLLAASGIALQWTIGWDAVRDGIFAGFIWAALFYIVGVGYLKLRGFHGLGFGDVKLMFGIGIWLGYLQTILVVFAAAISGIVAILLIGLLRRQNTYEILGSGVAFGPFLSLCAWSIWLFGESF